MEIGFIRQTRRTSAERQSDDLKAAGPRIIESEWNVAQAHIRPGGILVVTSLHLLAPNEDELRTRLRQIEEHGGQVKDLGTGQVHAPHTLLAYKALRQAWQTEKHCLDPKEMSRRGKKGGRPPALPPGSPGRKMAMTYKRLGKTEAETLADLETMHGVKVSRNTLARLWARTK